MGRVVYTQLDTGTSSASDMNTILSAVAAQSSQVDGENIAEGGVDRSRITTAAVSTRAFAPVVNTATGSQALTTSWVVCDPGGINPIRSGSAFFLGANDLVRIRGSIELLTDGASYGLAAGDSIDVRIAFQRDANPLAGTTPQVGATAARDGSVRIPIFAVILGTTNSGTFNTVELQVSDQSGGGATVQYGRVQLQAAVFKGVV